MRPFLIRLTGDCHTALILFQVFTENKSISFREFNSKKIGTQNSNPGIFSVEVVLHIDDLKTHGNDTNLLKKTKWL